MRPSCLAVVLGGIAMLASIGLAQHAPTAGPYKVLRTVKVGGEGGFDYIFADVKERRLYTPRTGPKGHLAVFNLDTLEPLGDIDSVRAGGATVDPKSHHGFSTTKPITMWDSKTLKVIKTIDVDGRPDGIMFDPYNERVWVLSHTPPYATVIDAKQGTVVGTLDLGGGPEQAVSDGKGTIYVNISDKANIAVVDAKNMTVTAHYDVSSKGRGGSGLAFDGKNHILFAYYRQPSPMVVIVNAKNGNIITTLPTGMGCGYRRLQSRHQGSHKRGQRRLDDLHQGKQSHKLRGRADTANRGGRQDTSPRHKDESRANHDGRVRAAPG
jgi:hypothetical protein